MVLKAKYLDKVGFTVGHRRAVRNDIEHLYFVCYIEFFIIIIIIIYTYFEN